MSLLRIGAPTNIVVAIAASILFLVLAVVLIIGLSVSAYSKYQEERKNEIDEL